MHDPVITPSGHTFERTSILRHIQRNPVDPITRAPMTIRDLRPNYALKAACDEFLAKNGWAVDDWWRFWNEFFIFAAWYHIL